MQIHKVLFFSPFLLFFIILFLYPLVLDTLARKYSQSSLAFCSLICIFD